MLVSVTMHINVDFDLDDDTQENQLDLHEIGHAVEHVLVNEKILDDMVDVVSDYSGMCVRGIWIGQAIDRHRPSGVSVHVETENGWSVSY